MKINKNISLGVLLIAVAVLSEVFWIQTGTTILGAYTLAAGLAASGAFAQAIRLAYEASRNNSHYAVGAKN